MGIYMNQINGVETMPKKEMSEKKKSFLGETVLAEALLADAVYRYRSALLHCENPSARDLIEKFVKGIILCQHGTTAIIRVESEKA